MFFISSSWHFKRQWETASLKADDNHSTHLKGT